MAEEESYPLTTATEDQFIRSVQALIGNGTFVSSTSEEVRTQCRLVGVEDNLGDVVLRGRSPRGPFDMRFGVGQVGPPPTPPRRLTWCVFRANTLELWFPDGRRQLFVANHPAAGDVDLALAAKRLGLGEILAQHWDAVRYFARLGQGEQERASELLERYQWPDAEAQLHELLASGVTLAAAGVASERADPVGGVRVLGDHVVRFEARNGEYSCNCGTPPGRACAGIMAAQILGAFPSLADG